MDADVDKSTEVGDVGDDAWQFHTFDEVVNGIDTRVELKLLYLLTWVTARLFQFLENIGKGGNTHLCRYVSIDVDGLAFLFIIYKVVDRASLIFGHLLNDGVALWMNG